MSLLLPRALVCALLAVPAGALACSGVLHVEIRDTGVYRLDHAAMAAAQPALADCASADLRLTQGGDEVPLRVVDGDDGRFGAGDHIEWVGRQLHGPESWYNQYSLSNAYLLSAAPGPHARMREATASAPGNARLERIVRLEQENLMIRLDNSQQQPGQEPDVWQWAKLTHADPQPFSTAFDLPDLAAHGGPVELTLNLRGMSRVFAPYEHRALKPDDHQVIVSINGHAMAPQSWDGRDEATHTLSVPAAFLKSGGNVLSLVVPKRPLAWDPSGNPAVDVVMFNWASFRFPVQGNVDAESTALQVASTPGAFTLRSRGSEAPVLYGEDGVRRTGTALGGGRFAFAAADAGVPLHPLADTASPARPVSLRAAAADRWSAPATGYDYLIVSHASLIDAIRPLAEFHEKRGLKVAVIDVQEVYDTFNHGIVHPQAIRNLVKHAYHDWPAPRPRFLLLVGDASFDIRHDTYNDLAYAKFANNPTELAYPGHFAGIPGTQYDDSSKRMAGRNLIPTWQFPSPEGQSASDNAFGSVDGDSFHPVVAVGRFPVAEPDEVSAIVDKTIHYMTSAQPGNWRRDVMFITDESDYFKKASDQIADSIASEGFLADKIYASKDEADNLAHQSAIKDGLNGGQLLVHFIGHGGRYIWRTGPPDIRKNHDLFTLDDVSALNNGGRLPMVLSMTCYSAPFDNPTEDSIGERFLRESDKGAVAVFAASWRNAPSTEFSKALVSELLTPGATIGEGIVRAKAVVTDRVLVEMYNLLGDPAVVLERPRDTALVSLRDDRWNPSLGIALPGPRFDGEIDVDWLDADGRRVAGGRYRIAGTRFDLPIPRVGDGSEIASVRLYAGDPVSGRDATASFDIRAERERIAALAAARIPQAQPASVPTPPPARKPAAADTVSRAGFDAEPPAAQLAGN